MCRCFGYSLSSRELKGTFPDVLYLEQYSIYYEVCSNGMVYRQLFCVAKSLRNFLYDVWTACVWSMMC